MTDLAKTNEPGSLLALVGQDDWKKRIQEALGSRTQTFITTLVSLTKEDPKLLECVPETVVAAALIATSMNLPVQRSLGMAYVIPYKTQGGKMVAQFQAGYRAFTALAIRTGEYSIIHPTEVYEGQLVSQNSFTGEFEFQEARTSDTIIGYSAYFRLHNGFSKQLYWTREEVLAHATKYSKSFAGQYKASSKWATDEVAMGKKTVLKMLIDKYGPKSIEVQRALMFDQAVSTTGEDMQYPDNPNNDYEMTIQDKNGNEVKVKESSQEKNQSIESNLKNKIDSKPAPPSFVTYKEPSEPDNTEEEIAELKAEFKEMGLTSYKNIQIAVLKINAKEKFPAEADFFATVSEGFPKELGEAIKG